MAEIEQQIAFYHTGSLICLVIMTAAFALAVFFFIKFKIPKAISLMSGRRFERSVEKTNPKTDIMKTEGTVRFEIIEHSVIVHTDEFI